MCKYHKDLIELNKKLREVIQAHKEVIYVDEKLLKRALVYLQALVVDYVVNEEQPSKDLVDLILGIKSVLVQDLIGGDK
uniref:Uncharacterized protein n=1 Tax=Dulem virus 90 TaxID=3145801 RepID=A0AAU8B054_9VIRU